MRLNWLCLHLSEPHILYPPLFCPGLRGGVVIHRPLHRDHGRHRVAILVSPRREDMVDAKRRGATEISWRGLG